MGKIKRKKLERGAKLTREPIFDPLTAAAQALNGLDVEREQLECDWAPFRLNFSVPYLGPDCDSSEWSVPFVLPPLQDDMAFRSTDITYTDARGASATSYDLSPDVSGEVLPVFLDEVSFGFDQRDAPFGVSSPWSGELPATAIPNPKYGVGGKMNPALLDTYDIRLSIMEKDPLFFVAMPERRKEDLQVPKREVWSVHIKPESFGNDVFSLNPFVVESINELIDPWKTYVFTVHAPKIFWPPANSVSSVLPSVEISLKFRRPIEGDTRRLVDNKINAPTSSRAAVTRTAAGTDVAITTPAANTSVGAETSTGINTNIAAIDTAMREKVFSGFNEHSEAGTTLEAKAEELLPDGAYEVITVPLFQNNPFGGISRGFMANSPPPYAKETTAADRTLIDRRIIPINFPFLIHHVIVAFNFQPFVRYNATVGGILHPGWKYASNPAGAMKYHVGVGAGYGMHGDGLNYRQIAEAELYPGSRDPAATGIGSFFPWKQDSLIDLVMSGPKSALPYVQDSFGKFQPAHNMSLHCVPLTAPTATIASTFPAYDYDPALTPPLGKQRAPVLVGRSWTRTGPRTNIVTTGGIREPSGTKYNPGEQWLEVRCKINAVPDAASPSYEDNSIIVGYQGFFVYIIGKKFLAS